MYKKIVEKFLLFLCFFVVHNLAASTGLPHFDHIVIVIEENHTFREVVGASSAPYMNALIAKGALFTNSFAVVPRGSQPNYLALFSGETQNVGDEYHPKFHAECLGSILKAFGKTFVGYAEGLPSVGFDGISHGNYVRRHNPFTQFTTIPDVVNQPFSAFPSDFHKLPTVSIVVPDLIHDAHSASLSAADGWLHKYLGAYAEWAKTHNSLLIVTFDESSHTLPAPKNIPTIFYGAHVKPGRYNEKINHYTILRTIEDIYGLPHLGHSASVKPITDVWN